MPPHPQGNTDSPFIDYRTHKCLKVSLLHFPSLTHTRSPSLSNTSLEKSFHLDNSSGSLSTQLLTGPGRVPALHCTFVDRLWKLFKFYRLSQLASHRSASTTSVAFWSMLKYKDFVWQKCSHHDCTWARKTMNETGNLYTHLPVILYLPLSRKCMVSQDRKSVV